MLWRPGGRVAIKITETQENEKYDGAYADAEQGFVALRGRACEYPSHAIAYRHNSYPWDKRIYDHDRVRMVDNDRPLNMQKVPEYATYTLSRRVVSVESIVPKNEQQAYGQNNLPGQIHECRKKYHATADGPDDLQYNAGVIGSECPTHKHQGYFNQDQP